MRIGRKRGIPAKIIKKKVIDRFNEFMNTLFCRSPPWLTGRPETWRSRLLRRYGGLLPQGEMEERILRERRRLFFRYVCVLALGAPVLLAWAAGTAFGGGEKEIGAIRRPEYGQPSYRAPLVAQIEYQGQAFKRKLELLVRPAELSLREQEAKLDSLAAELPRLILGKNQSLDSVSRPLNLMGKDEATGAQIRWRSSHPSLVGDDGTVNAFSVKGPETVALAARLRLGEAEREVNVKVTVAPPKEAGPVKEGLARKLDRAVREAEKERDDGSSKIHLPARLGPDIKVRWTKRRNSGTAEAAALLFGACAWLYSRRYAGAERELGRRLESISGDFPYMATQMALLLNAGLVVSAALLEVADFGEGEEDGRRPLFQKLSEIAVQVRQSNASFPKELLAFSRSIGLRELIRFSVLVCDNIDKGSLLADKLEREGEMLRELRKRKVQEKARLAETKLSFPMMLLLLVLILIAVAPVLLTV